MHTISKHTADRHAGEKQQVRKGPQSTLLSHDAQASGYAKQEGIHHAFAVHHADRHIMITFPIAVINCKYTPLLMSGGRQLRATRVQDAQSACKVKLQLNCK